MNKKTCTDLKVVNSRRYKAEILPIRRKSLSNQSTKENGGAIPSVAFLHYIEVCVNARGL